jgi:hypothetical protein
VRVATHRRSLRRILQQLAQRGLLARFVIDEV